MCRVICFKHSSYNGKDRPNLACKVCCSLFINEIRKEKAVKVINNRSTKKYKKVK